MRKAGHHESDASAAESTAAESTAADSTAAEELALEADESEGYDLESAMREAVAAVEEVEKKRAEGDSGEVAAARARERSLEEELAQLRAEHAEVQQRSARNLADFDNFRKRVEREKGEYRRYALFDPLRQLLGVVDNLERALASGGTVEDLKHGVGLILRQFQDFLERHGVKTIPAAGQPFDPSVHEAVARREDPAVTVPTVTEEMQQGYLLYDRLLRPALVNVAVPVESTEGSEPSQEAETEGDQAESQAADD